MTVHRVSLQWLLPMIGLTTWVALVPLHIGVEYYRLRHVSQDSEQAIDILGEMAMKVPKERWLTVVIASLPLSRYRAVTAMNLPGLIPDVLLSLVTSQPGKWHPSTLPLESWRSLSLPFFCLPFWWFVGLGFDRLRRRQRLNVAALCVTSTLFLVSVAILVGYFTSPPRDRVDLGWLLPGVGLWATLFGIISLNGLRRNLGASDSKPYPD